MIKYLFFFLIIIGSNFIKAEDSLLTLKQQVERLQREVSDLSETVYKSSSKKINQTSEAQIIESIDLTTFDLRIYDLEKDIKKLNENFEELIFEIDDLEKMYEKLSLDFSTNLITNKNNSLLEEKNIDIKKFTNNNTNDQKNILGTIVINSEDLSNLEIETIEENLNLEETLDELKNPEEEFQKAFDMLRNQEFNDAKEALLDFINRYSDSELSGSAHYWLGEIYILKKEYREAALILAEGFQKYPKSLKAPDMLYKLSDSLFNINKKKEACGTLEKFNKEFPKHELSTKSKNKIISLGCVISIE